MANELGEVLGALLKTDERLVAKDGSLLKNKVQELAGGDDSQLLSLLYSESEVRQHFFTNIGDFTIFQKDKFLQFSNAKEWLPDSYTAFKNKIGLATHQKAFDGMDKIAAGLKREFLPEFVAGPQWYFAAQLVQARAVEIGLKHFRSQYDTCSGSVLWQYNDMWPAISWAVSDSAGSRKLSWYAMREAYRPRLLHFSGVNRELVIINDTTEHWRDQLYLIFLNEMGEITETRNVAISIEGKSQFRLKTYVDFESNGYVVAQMGELRAARRVLDKPVAQLNSPMADIKATATEELVSVVIKARNFIHEFSLLPELIVANPVTVSAQRLTILPGEQVVIEIQCSNSSDAQKVVHSVEQIAWSLNKLVASPAQ